MGKLSFIVSTLSLIALFEFTAFPAESKPKLNEIVDLLKSKLSIVKAEEIEEAALEGILSKYSNLVQIIYGDSKTQSPELIRKTTILETNIAYFHIKNIGSDLANQFKTRLAELEKSNTIKGLIIDLRFAGGNDYVAGAQLVDLFFDDEKIMFSIGERVFKSTQKTKRLEFPTVVLINKETMGAAEVVAEILRLNKLALLIGANTSGNAYLFDDFKLSTGQTLKIAIGIVKINGKVLISTNGVEPEIYVGVDLNEEREFILNPHKVPGRLAGVFSESAGGFQQLPKKINEAELVRMKREGAEPASKISSGESAASVNTAPGILIVHDPVLARAIDLLKVLLHFDFERFRK